MTVTGAASALRFAVRKCPNTKPANVLRTVGAVDVEHDSRAGVLHDVLDRVPAQIPDRGRHALDAPAEGVPGDRVVRVRAQHAVDLLPPQELASFAAPARSHHTPIAAPAGGINKPAGACPFSGEGPITGPERQDPDDTRIARDVAGGGDRPRHPLARRPAGGSARDPRRADARPPVRGRARRRRPGEVPRPGRCARRRGGDGDGGPPGQCAHAAGRQPRPRPAAHRRRRGGGRRAPEPGGEQQPAGAPADRRSSCR